MANTVQAYYLKRYFKTYEKKFGKTYKKRLTK